MLALAGPACFIRGVRLGESSKSDCDRCHVSGSLTCSKLRSPPTFHQPSTVHHNNTALQVRFHHTASRLCLLCSNPVHLQTPAMGGNPPNYSGSDAFGNPTGQPVYPPAPVYQQATAPTSSSPPAVPGLPQRPQFNAPTLSKDEMANMHALQWAVANVHKDSKAQSSHRPSQNRADVSRAAKALDDDVKLARHEDSGCGVAVVITSIINM